MTDSQIPVNFATTEKELILKHFLPSQLQRIGSDQSSIPRLAKSRDLMAQIETVLPDLPTFHRFHLFDSTQIDFLNNKSVHLILTSPPYWNLKEYNKSDRQLGNIANFESFLDELNRVWEICFGVLVPGGRLICVVGDVCLSRRKNNGRHSVIPLHASIQEQCRKIGFDNLAPIIWSKIANAAFESDRGSTFLGKPYEPNAIIKNDIEFILMERKPGGYRSPSFTERLFSVISEENHKLWFNQIWTGITGASTNNHPAPFPVEFASRLIRMFSFVGDVVLDPFAGSGSTALAAWSTGRNSINVEIDPTYFDFAVDRFHDTSGRMLVNHVVEIHR